MFAIRDFVPDRLPEFLGPVRYKIDEVCTRHNAALEEAVAIFLDTVNANDDLMADEAVGKPFMDHFVREIIAQPIIWNCLTSKHPAYEHEQEVRLVIMGMPKFLLPHIATRHRGSDIRPVYCASDAIARAAPHCRDRGRGPAASSDAERTVRTTLASLGLDPNIEVGRSDIPYRAL